MAGRVQALQYYHTTVPGDPGEGHKLLTHLADQMVNLVAFHSVPSVSGRTLLTIFPEDHKAFEVAAQRANLDIEGPHSAILLQGDDQRGALARVYRVLVDANVVISAAIGLAVGGGRYGSLLYVRDEDAERASKALADEGV